MMRARSFRGPPRLIWRMKTKNLLAAVVIGLAFGLTASARAGVSVKVTFGAPVSFHPPVVIAAPCPPVVICPPVAHRPAPVIGCRPVSPPCPPVVYVTPHRDRHGNWRHDRWSDRDRHHYGHGQDRDRGPGGRR